jgi:hypothetical protein
VDSKCGVCTTLANCLHVQQIEIFFSGPRKGRNSEIDSISFTLFQRFQNEKLPLTGKELMSQKQKNFKASHEWCEEFMNRESLSL